MKRLWKPGHSVSLSLVVTYLAGACLLAMMIFLPRLLRVLFGDSLPSVYLQFYLNLLFYACCPAGITAIASLLLLLHNIRKGDVFTRRNVKLLRLLSWCFVFVALVSVYATYIYYPCALILVASAFLAVILRVVKNVMEQATIMREEQELTI